MQHIEEPVDTVRSAADRIDCRVVAVIPAFRAAPTLARVVALALQVVDAVVVVDDACPERCGSLVEEGPRVHVHFHEKNGGVGAAVKTGIAHALRLGAVYIVKIDADDQMDVENVPQMLDILERYPEIDLVKGNRFADRRTVRGMPTIRLIGNAGLTLLVKLSSGYWTLVDPTNGFIAIRASSIDDSDIAGLANRYFFEADLLCMYGMRKRPIAEIEMPAIYAGERSSLSITRAFLSFPPKLFARFLRRVLYNYVITEINVGSLCALTGLPLLTFAIIFGGWQWALSSSEGVGRPTGTIVLALLLFMTGFQLCLQALLYDVQFGTQTLKFRNARGRVRH